MGLGLGAGGWGAGAGARGLAKRIQFATGYVPALASGLLGRSAKKSYPCWGELGLQVLRKEFQKS